MKNFLILIVTVAMTACSGEKPDGDLHAAENVNSSQPIPNGMDKSPESRTDTIDSDIADKAAGSDVSSEALQSKTTRHLKKWEDGVNFHAIGNEPFWNLDIDYDRGMQFSTMDGYAFQAPMGTPNQTNDGEIREYRSKIESGEMIVILDDSGCTDNMSGEPFDYRVTVKVKESTDTDFSVFSGCGEYVVDPRLHNIWVIEKFQGKMIDHDQFARGIPQMEINVRDDNYMGHDGCNSIRGGVSLTSSRITFASGPATLMACDQDISQNISAQLVSGPMEYSFTDGRLQLMRDGDVVFVLKNVD